MAIVLDVGDGLGLAGTAGEGVTAGPAQAATIPRITIALTALIFVATLRRPFVFHEHTT